MYKNAKTIVVKIGASVLIKGNRLDFDKFKDIAQDISLLIEEGRKVVIVSSGAIAFAMSKLKLRTKPDSLAKLQALASLGQIELLKLYQKSFSRHSIEIAQVLLTWDDFSVRKRYLNASETLAQLLKLKIVPVINENDAIAVEEIKLGDNDRLSAMVASMVGADLLLILSDVDGIYDREGRLIKKVKDIKEIRDYCLGTNKDFCVGGMATKLEASKIVTALGIPCIISNGKIKNAVYKTLRDNLGTYIQPAKRLKARKHWLAYLSKPKGAIIIDSGAEEAVVRRGKSILPKGILRVEGSFDKGELIMILNPENREIARGITNYSSMEINKIKGVKTTEVEFLLGRKKYDEVVYRDNLVLTGGRE